MENRPRAKLQPNDNKRMVMGKLTIIVMLLMGKFEGICFPRGRKHWDERLKNWRKAKIHEVSVIIPFADEYG